MTNAPILDWIESKSFMNGHETSIQTKRWIYSTAQKIIYFSLQQSFILFVVGCLADENNYFTADKTRQLKVSQMLKLFVTLIWIKVILSYWRNKTIISLFYLKSSWNVADSGSYNNNNNLFYSFFSLRVNIALNLEPNSQTILHKQSYTNLTMIS